MDSNWTTTAKTFLRWFVTIKAQTSLRIRAVSSANLLSAFLDESNLHLLREKIQFLARLFSRRDWFKTRFVGNPEDRFSRVVACVAGSTSLGHILQVQQTIILKKLWGGCSSDILTGVTLLDCALHRQIYKSFVTTAHRAREWRGLWFPGCGSLVWPCTNSTFARLGRGYQWLVRIFFSPLCTSHFWPRTSPEECRGQWLCVCSSP